MEKRNQNDMYWDARADFEIMSDLAAGARNAARKFGEVRGKMFEQDLEPEIPEWAIRQLRSRLEEPMTSPCHMAAWDTIQGLLNHLADEVDKVKVEKSKELKGATKKAMTQSGRYVQADVQPQTVDLLIERALAKQEMARLLDEAERGDA